MPLNLPCRWGPRAYIDYTLSSKPVHRVWCFATIFGSEPALPVSRHCDFHFARSSSDLVTCFSSHSRGSDRLASGNPSTARLSTSALLSCSPFVSGEDTLHKLSYTLEKKRCIPRDKISHPEPFPSVETSSPLARNTNAPSSISQPAYVNSSPPSPFE